MTDKIGRFWARVAFGIGLTLEMVAVVRADIESPLAIALFIILGFIYMIFGSWEWE